jgi:SAM-dependent methyltransferase
VRQAIVGAVTFSLFQTGRFFARVARVFYHLAAGTLTIDRLRLGIERTWEDFSAGDADIAAGLMRWEEEMVSRFVAGSDDVLLVGSGSGRDLVALAGGGYHVTAVEPIGRAVATCRRQLAMRNLTADVIEGFFEDVALPRRFDVIIFSGCCYDFIPESRRRIGALRKAADHLAPRGRILVNYMKAQSSRPLLIHLARFTAAVTRSDWRPERGDVILPVGPPRPLFHYEHPFGPGELEAEALAAGLRATHHCDFPSASVIVLESSTMDLSADGADGRR